MIEISVIVSTRNRASYLEEAVQSLVSQALNKALYEIIVVDNGSTDNTPKVVEKLSQTAGERVRYLYVSEPGLHAARHAGARAARGKILTFTDDDIVASPVWLEMILKRFDSKEVAVVGGKVLPEWEGEVPPWVEEFRVDSEFGWTIAYLSLLDFGDVSREIPGEFVFGCNLSIRKEVLFDCGGFHPDAMPKELIQYRGDGETALAKAVQGRGYKIMYEPKAVVYHRIPPDRLTEEYVCHRAFSQGISQSYTEIRRRHGLDQPSSVFSDPRPSFPAAVKRIGMKMLSKKKSSKRVLHPVRSRAAKAREEGRSFHKRQVSQDPKILEHVLQKTYF